MKKDIKKYIKKYNGLNIKCFFATFHIRTL